MGRVIGEVKSGNVKSPLTLCQSASRNSQAQIRQRVRGEIGIGGRPIRVAKGVVRTASEARETESGLSECLDACEACSVIRISYHPVRTSHMSCAVQSPHPAHPKIRLILIQTTLLRIAYSVLFAAPYAMHSPRTNSSVTNNLPYLVQSIQENARHCAYCTLLCNLQPSPESGPLSFPTAAPQVTLNALRNTEYALQTSPCESRYPNYQTRPPTGALSTLFTRATV